ncbi:MAG: thioredoxin [Acidimicrobiia bacterium]
MAKPLAVTDSEFDQEVLEADTPVLVDLWAEWCGPCHQLDPIIAELAEEYDGRIKFVKLDTEENFDTPARYGIMGLPALLVFKDGEQVDAIMGLRPKSDLKRSLDKALG